MNSHAESSGLRIFCEGGLERQAFFVEAPRTYMLFLGNIDDSGVQKSKSDGLVSKETFRHGVMYFPRFQTRADTRMLDITICLASRTRVGWVPATRFLITSELARNKNGSGQLGPVENALISSQNKLCALGSLSWDRCWSREGTG